VNVFFAFRKIDGFTAEHLRKTIRDPLDTLQVPNNATAPIGSALPERFLAIRLQVADNFIEKIPVSVHIPVAINLAPLTSFIGGFRRF
jgi:hypothetical protein